MAGFVVKEQQSMDIPHSLSQIIGCNVNAVKLKRTCSINSSDGEKV